MFRTLPHPMAGRLNGSLKAQDSKAFKLSQFLCHTCSIFWEVILSSHTQHRLSTAWHLGCSQETQDSLQTHVLPAILGVHSLLSLKITIFVLLWEDQMTYWEVISSSTLPSQITFILDIWKKKKAIKISFMKICLSLLCHMVPYLDYAPKLSASWQKTSWKSKLLTYIHGSCITLSRYGERVQQS